MPPTRSAPDAEAFERFYRAHREQVFATCYRLCGDRARAAEWLQDVFVRMWEQWGTLTDPERAGGWVHRVTLNTVFNIKRSDQRRLGRVALASDLPSMAPEPATEGASPFATPAPIRRIDLERAIATLTGRSREVFVLHDVEGISAEDVAHLLRIAPSTVRVLLSRARARLREVLST
ncbi:MAG: sigma-70 family RNA polymerase sigma factor [Gemmatimonadaceae bacterium]|nr:sigma-70 family RNA polymerase sigma factor [Gemmatimonadaceae bacterium]